MDRNRRVNLLLDFVSSSEYLRQIVIGASRFCEDHPKYYLRRSTDEAALLPNAEDIDGVLAVIEMADPNHTATRFGKPVVNISSICSPVPFPTVALDNAAVGRAAAEHLLARGYRCFGYHLESRVFFSRERHRGFVEKLNEAGHPCAAFDTGRTPDATAAENHAATVRWVRDLPKPLGLATHTDARAAALLGLCMDSGIEVPHEVGIIGVDDDPMSTLTCTPKLTSVDPASANIGYRAAELLSGILEGRPPRQARLVLPPGGVIARASTEPLAQVDARLADAQRYIEANADRDIRVDDVLEAVLVSRRSLERLFKDHLGRSPAEEIRRARVNRVKWRLIGSQRPVAEIAQACGFTSLRTFAKAFREEVGMTPAAYRDRVLLGAPPAPPQNGAPRRIGPAPARANP
jgi:LacI family transcriptional regulator